LFSCAEQSAGYTWPVEDFYSKGESSTSTKPVEVASLTPPSPSAPGEFIHEHTQQQRMGQGGLRDKNQLKCSASI